MSAGGRSVTRRRRGAIVVAAALALALAAAAGAATVSRGEKELHVDADGRRVLTYRYRPTPYKAYVRTLRTPSGVNVLLDSPDDHRHHHALMFALEAGGTSFWHEFAQQGPGTQAHRELKVLTGEKQPPGFLHRLDWQSPDGETLLLERRTCRLPDAGTDRPTLLDWRTRLSLPEGAGSTTLTGHHYHGLGMRFVRAMDGNCRFFNPTGKPGEVFRGDERLVRARWCACTCEIDGRPVTAAMFDHPDNPRHPAKWFTMAKPFAYLSATMKLHEEPMELRADRPLTLRYGVALWDGEVGKERIEKVYRRWLELSGHPVAGGD